MQNDNTVRKSFEDQWTLTEVLELYAKYILCLIYNTANGNWYILMNNYYECWTWI